VDGEDVENEEQKIAEVAVRYIAVAERLTGIAARRITGLEALKTHVLKHLDEEKSRAFESQVHSVQSKYDTFVRATGLESKTPALSRLRGHASVALHLLEMGTELVHFYVRHENDVRYELAKQKISALIDKAIVLDRIVNFASYFAQLVLARGRVFAEEVLKLFVVTNDIELRIPDAYSLHARPISLIVRIVTHYGTPVQMVIDGEACNAGSIMEMILAIGNRPGARKVGFRGDSRALADIRVLFESGLGERGVQELPRSLDYLKG
jgi:phosphotransferase system HPr (HPr) family protein